MSWNDLPIDWDDSKLVLAVRYPSTWVAGDSEAAQTKQIVLGTVESFTARITTPGTIIDSLNNGNQGNVEGHSKYTLDIITMPYGDGFDLLQKAQNGRRYFDLILAPAEFFDGNQNRSLDSGLPQAAWTPVKEVFKGCKVRDNSSRIATGSKPTVTFSCTALRFVFNPSSDVNNELGTGYTGPNATDAALGIV